MSDKMQIIEPGVMIDLELKDIISRLVALEKRVDYLKQGVDGFLHRGDATPVEKRKVVPGLELKLRITCPHCRTPTHYREDTKV